MATNSSIPELNSLANQLEAAAALGQAPGVKKAIVRLQGAAQKIGESWSGSSFGYHSRIYYEDFAVPPPGAHFDAERGLAGVLHGSTGDWREYAFDNVIERVNELAENPSLEEAVVRSREAREIFLDCQAATISILTAAEGVLTDTFVGALKEEAQNLTVLSEEEVLRAQLPRGTLASRDSTAISQGLQPAPHQQVLAKCMSLDSPFNSCHLLSKVARRASAHIERIESASKHGDHPGRSIFIGHGRSADWRELKDFIERRLGLPVDEFNQQPIAGITNVDRLKDMLDGSTMAFLILTAEDERVDGAQVARQNVVHEAGLFQGRLGFGKAIIVLEEGCDEFSNIHGLGQLRFPPRRISSIFEDVRRLFERERIL